MTQDNTLTDAIDETLAAAVTPPKKAKAKRPAKAKAKDETKSEEPQAKPPRNVKPKADTFHGFELKETSVDIKALEEATQELSQACDAILRKDADLLSSYLTIGRAASDIAPLFKSTKLYGQFLAQHVPASQALDPALRTNCKWLFEALNHKDHEASDILSILGVNRIEDFKSGNPTVIKREYKAAKSQTELTAKAEEEGITVEEVKKKEREEASELLREKINAFLSAMEKRRSKAEIVADVGDVLSDLLLVSPKEGIARMISLL